MLHFIFTGKLFLDASRFSSFLLEMDIEIQNCFSCLSFNISLINFLRNSKSIQHAAFIFIVKFYAMTKMGGCVGKEIKET